MNPSKGPLFSLVYPNVLNVRRRTAYFGKVCVSNQSVLILLLQNVCKTSERNGSPFFSFVKSSWFILWTRQPHVSSISSKNARRDRGKILIKPILTLEEVCETA